MNSCGDCTACCRSLGFTGDVQPIYDPEKEAEKLGIIFPAFGTCNKVCSTGCTIYEKRPTICKKFECAFIEYDLEPQYKPNRCGILAEVKPDHILFTVVDSKRLGVSSSRWLEGNRDFLNNYIEELSILTRTRYKDIYIASYAETIHLVGTPTHA